MWNIVNVRVHVISSWFMIRWLVYFTIYEFNCWTFKLLQFKLLLKIGFEWITWFKWWIVYGRSCLQTSIRSKRFSLLRLIEANNIGGNVDNLYVWQSWSKSFLMDHQAFIPIFYHLMISSWTVQLEPCQRPTNGTAFYPLDHVHLISEASIFALIVHFNSFWSISLT